MATFSIKIRGKRNDGYYPVYICVNHKSKPAYIKTSFVVSDKGLTLKRAQELVKTMYQLIYRLPNSRETHTQVLGISDEQHRLYETVGRWCR